MAIWQVPYQQGELKAIGFDAKGKAIQSSILATAAAPVKIKLTADKKLINANNQDLSYITVELLDAKNNRHPLAENLIKFKVEGDATIVGIGNANPVSVESYQASQRKAWQGRCLVILKAGKNGGQVNLTAETEGIPSASISIQIENKQ